MSSLNTLISSSVDKKIDLFIAALHEQLGLEKEDLYEVFNSLSDDSSDKKSDKSSSSEHSENSDNEEVKEKEKNKKPAVKNAKKEKTKCEYLFTKGKNQGTTCGVSTDGSKYCKKHNKDSDKETETNQTIEVSEKSEVKEVKEVKETTTVETNNTKSKTPTKKADKDAKCEYLFTKGKNEGTKCGASTGGSQYCKKHNKEEKTTTATKTETTGKKTTKTAKNANSEQKDKEVVNRLVSHEKEVKKTEPALSLSRNKFGNFEMVDTGFVFDPKTRQVVGTQNDNGNIDDLTKEDIELCKEYNFKFLIPEKLKSKITASDSETDLEDEDLDEEELEEDDEDDEDFEDEEEDDE